jgi:hypothetical protein
MLAGAKKRVTKAGSWCALTSNAEQFVRIARHFCVKRNRLPFENMFQQLKCVLF